MGLSTNAFAGHDMCVRIFVVCIHPQVLLHVNVIILMLRAFSGDPKLITLLIGIGFGQGACDLGPLDDSEYPDLQIFVDDGEDEDVSPCPSPGSQTETTTRCTDRQQVDDAEDDGGDDDGDDDEDDAAFVCIMISLFH